MDELGLDAANVAAWFQQQHVQPCIVIGVDKAHATSWTAQLLDAVRRAYITDAAVVHHAAKHQVAQEVVIASKLPDPGSVMAGDFGEILVYVYQAAAAHPKKLFGPKKWRLKQDRTKAAPHSDVVQFHLPKWPSASTEDAILCSEVKTKSTASAADPIGEAIRDSAKDRTSRLARTLLWLRERAMTEELGAVQLSHLDRFINATEHPAANRHFFAVAVICSSLIQAELMKAASVDADGCSLIVLDVPNLKATYMAVFEAALKSIST
jgi:hypothetical protein